MRSKKQTTIKSKLLFVSLVAFLLAIALSSSASAALTSASIRQVSNSTIQNVLYYPAGSGYKDNVGSTPDVKLRVCTDTPSDISGKNIAAFYAIAPTNSSLFLYDILGGDTIARFIPLGSTFSVGPDTCADANFEFFAGRSPYPAKIFVAVDINGNAGENIDYGTDLVIAVNMSGYLPTSYSRNNVQASYVQATGNIVVDATGTSPGVAVSNVNKILLGACTDELGVTCTDTARTTLAAGGSTLYTGIINPPDSTTYLRYSVINGYGASYCIGPDVDVQSVTAVPGVGPAGTMVTLSANVFNVNNVDVTTNFIVEFWVGGNNVCNATLNQPLAKGTSKSTTTCVWNTAGVPSGTTTITAIPRDAAAGIADCDDTNDQGTGQFSTELVWLPTVWINGVQTNVFPDAGRPYNVTINIRNSDGNTPSVEIRLIEENGMNIFAPNQFYTISTGNSGVIPRSMASIRTDPATGNISFAVVPTGTKLYDPEFAYLNAGSYVGNHSIYFEIFSSSNPNTELQLFYNSAKQDKYWFNLLNITPRTPTALEEDSQVVIYQNVLVKQALDLAYRSLATAVKWLK